MAFETLCAPALIYIFFSVTQIIIDTYNGLYNTAFLKAWVAIIFTILLNYLCKVGLGVVSWLIVFIPFILMTLIIAILLLAFGLDPSSGRTVTVSTPASHNNTQPPPPDYRAIAARHVSSSEKKTGSLQPSSMSSLEHSISSNDIPSTTDITNSLNNAMKQM